MKGKHLAAIAILALLLPIAVVVSFLYEPYTWGANGALTLTISLDRDSMAVRERLNVTLTLTNTGGTKIRVHDGFFTPSIVVYDSRNQAVRYDGPEACPPRLPNDEEFNHELMVMEPGMVRVFGRVLLNDTGPLNQSRHYHDGWDLQPGQTYSVIGSYHAMGGYPYPVLPHWSGQVASAPEQFTVTVG